MDSSVHSAEKIDQAFSKTIQAMLEGRVNTLHELLTMSGDWEVSKKKLHDYTKEAIYGHPEGRSLALLGMKVASKRMKSLLEEGVSERLSSEARGGAASIAWDISQIADALRTFENTELIRLAKPNGRSGHSATVTSSAASRKESHQDGHRRQAASRNTGRALRDQAIQDSSRSIGGVSGTGSAVSWLWKVRSQAMAHTEASVPQGTGDSTSITARRVFQASRKWCDLVFDEVLTAAVVVHLRNPQSTGGSGISGGDEVPDLYYGDTYSDAEDDDEIRRGLYERPAARFPASRHPWS